MNEGDAAKATDGTIAHRLDEEIDEMIRDMRRYVADCRARRAHSGAELDAIDSGPRVGGKVTAIQGNQRSPEMEIIEVSPMGLWLMFDRGDPPKTQIRFFGYARYDFELVRPA